VYDVVIKKFTFAISSADEFLVYIAPITSVDPLNVKVTMHRDFHIFCLS